MCAFVPLCVVWVLQPSGAASENIEAVKVRDIKAFLSQHSLTFKDGYTCFMTTCPRLNHSKLRLENINKLYLNSTNGQSRFLSRSTVLENSAGCSGDDPFLK